MAQDTEAPVIGLNETNAPAKVKVGRKKPDRPLTGALQSLKEAIDPKEDDKDGTAIARITQHGKRDTGNKP